MARRRPHRRLLALGGVATLVVAALLGLAGQGNHPAEVVVERPVDTPVRGRFLAVDGRGAVVEDPAGRTWAVDADGRTAWRTTELEGGVACARCPAAIGLDPLRSVSVTGAVTDPGWSAGATAYRGLYLRPEEGALQVSALGPDGPVALGRVASRSLDPAAYGFAPEVAAAVDGRSAAAVVGADEPLAIGRAEAVYLRAGQAAHAIAIDLADPGRAPAPCTPDGTDRWGWVDGVAGDQPWLGTATFTPADGGRAGTPIALGHPYAGCTITDSGVVLTSGNSGPQGTYPAVAWLDADGQVRRELQRVGADPSAVLSVARTGRVVLPAADGFDVLDPTGPAHHLVADDVRVAADGTVWVLRGATARRWTP